MRGLTIERTSTLILFLLLFALAARVPVDTDTPWHLRSGEYILQNGFIYADPFSHTFANEPWIDHSWGAQIILYGLWRVGGYLGLAVYMAGLATLGMAFVWKMGAGNAYLRAFALVLGAATAAVFWSPRPQMLSFALSAILLWLLYRYKQEGKDSLWWIPPLMAVWGNLHAGFSIGFIFMGGFIVGEALGNLFASNREHGVSWRGIRKLVLIALVSVAAICINPYGLNMLLVPFQTISIGALQNFIQEWNSPNFHERQTWPFIALLLGTFGVVGASRKRLDWTDFILFSGTCFMALTAGRNIAVFAVVATPIFMRHVDDALTARGWVMRPLQKTNPRMARLNAVLVGVVAFGAVAKTLLVLDSRTVNMALDLVFPVEAVAVLNGQNPPQPIFNSYNWGGYLIDEARDYPVFVDGRTDLYGDAFLTDAYFNTAVGGEGWRDTLNEYGINTVLVETSSGLGRALAGEVGWETLHSDDMATLFVREMLMSVDTDG